MAKEEAGTSLLELYTYQAFKAFERFFMIPKSEHLIRSHHLVTVAKLSQGASNIQILCTENTTIHLPNGLKT